MSFASETKEELCRGELSRRCCAQAEAYGALLYCNSFSAGGVRIVTESEAFAARLPQLFQKAFKVRFDRSPAEGERGKRVFLLEDREKLSRLFQTFGYDPRESVAHHINFAVLEEEHCRSAFFRGAFLAGGAVTDPAKRYHLELATSHYNVSREMTALLQEAGFSPKETTRKSNYITYFKQSEAIEGFLIQMGAPLAAMGLMNAKAEKALVGSVNRRVNCEAANLDKAVDAAMDQVMAIRALERRGILAELPEKLRTTAALRVENPDLTLTQLAALCDPPVTKSCLNHRLRKLVELSRS
ncbi:DNA-binding protein WhiA [Pseudoflavonifractor phocaeensis]|uniref:DNA-binding protein WhiA n=1 Tax=Pseudoflavonifractor phocaeensis TaxID=1870988 RepID=UPI00195D33FB|nr:DNA-binding protein WhiA [Pseudoflavonifractor phocaeensis]MBM6937542.1 DNA-binding protein WhiA [Pseudoflavonifractor phocaeensis]